MGQIVPILWQPHNLYLQLKASIMVTHYSCCALGQKVVFVVVMMLSNYLKWAPLRRVVPRASEHQQQSLFTINLSSLLLQLLHVPDYHHNTEHVVLSILFPSLQLSICQF